MLIHHEIEKQIRTAVARAQEAGVLPSFELEEVVVERPRDMAHGDYATPTGMKLARLARMAPLKIAQAIADHYPENEYLSEVTVVPPGFINFRVAEKVWQAQVEGILAADNYGGTVIGAGKKVQVEYVSANPTGPITIGRSRGGVIGDSLSRLLMAAGYDVTREYYYNNAGRQIVVLGESLKVRYQQALGAAVELGEDQYQGEYITDIANLLVEKHQDGLLDKPTEWFSGYAAELISEQQKASLKRLRIEHDIYYNERDLYDSGRVWDALDALRRRGYAYDQDDAVWFKSSDLGDDKDRVLIKSSGEPAYRMTDIAYHWHKAQRGFDWVIDIFGADHHATAPTVLMGIQALGYDSNFVHILLHQFVTLVREGEQQRMSTRKGNYVTIDELVDEVGVDAVRYFMLSRSSNSSIDFDLDLALERSDKNPVFYIQNAHVRCAGIFRKAEEAGYAADCDEGADISLLTNEAELAFLQKGMELAEMIEFSVRQAEPHHIAFYAYELANKFHAAYEQCRVLHDDVPEPLRLARLRFYRAAKKLLGHVLELMGMSAPEVM